MIMYTKLVLVGVNIRGSGPLREGRHDPRNRQWLLPSPATAYGDELATQSERPLRPGPP
jgi:hypothetical protein